MIESQKKEIEESNYNLTAIYDPSGQVQMGLSVMNESPIRLVGDLEAVARLVKGRSGVNLNLSRIHRSGCRAPRGSHGGVTRRRRI
jgi:hypothetical protein